MVRGWYACLGTVLALATLAAPRAGAYTVATGSADVRVDCGTSGTDVPTDWYFPQPNDSLGLVWLQHGFSRANNQMEDLARKIAVRTSPSRPGVVAVKLTGKDGAYAPGPLPPTVTVIFAPAGQCGDAAFSPPAGCALAGRRLSCR